MALPKYNIGDKFIAKNGSLCTLIARNDRHATLKYDNTNIQFTIPMSAIGENKIKDLIKNEDGTENPILFNSFENQFLNSHFITNDGFIFKVTKVEYPRALIIFDGYEEYGEISVRISQIQSGSIRCPFKVNKYGGFLGPKSYQKSVWKSYSYRLWFGLLDRHFRTERPANFKYKYSKICDEWKCFDNFDDWFNMYISTINYDPNIDFRLDKDLLYPYYKEKYGCKYYSPDTCVFIPNDINLTISVYRYKKEHINCDINDPIYKFKIKKEQKIKYLANYYKSINAINDQVFNLLMNFSVDLYIRC